jgi:hypothetical protein
VYFLAPLLRGMVLTLDGCEIVLLRAAQAC